VTNASVDVVEALTIENQKCSPKQHNGALVMPNNESVGRWEIVY